jgi:arginine-tRNA-protein transferase
MSHRDSDQAVTIRFYATAPYACSYLPGRMARSQVAIPSETIDRRIYSQLIQLGFRRSGLHTYRPYCDLCQACIPVRIPVAGFSPNRNQRRVWNRNQGLSTRLLPLKYDVEHYRLYRRYQMARHNGCGMSEDGPGQYAEFILNSGVDSWLVEFRQGETLKMVSLIDRLEDGLSAVYTFYEPDEAQAGYGNFNVLWQIDLTRRLGLEYVYLGYWIAESRKMVYKSNFRPLEKLQNGRWQPFD